LSDALRGIINDNSEVVRRNAIITQEHHVVDHGYGRSSNNIVDDVLLVVRAKAPRRRTATLFTL
jgi:hypothetical protein